MTAETKAVVVPAPPEHPSLAAALAAFQAEVPSVKKGNKARVPTKAGGEYTYDYADLADVTEAVLPLLGKHGLSFSSKPTLMMLSPDVEVFRLAYVLRHAGSGEIDEGMYPLPDPTKETPQNLGAALTYARRYVLCAVTGVAPGGDDTDAHESEAQNRPASSVPRLSQRRRDPERPTPDQPLRVPKPTKDWSGAALRADTIDELRKVREEAREAGELFLQLDGTGETVEQMFLRRHGFLTAKKPAPPAAPAPGAGPERDWVREARAASSKDELRFLLDTAVEAKVDGSVLKSIAEFEDGLPEKAPSAPEGDWPVAAPGSGVPKKGPSDA